MYTDRKEEENRGLSLGELFRKDIEEIVKKRLADKNLSESGRQILKDSLDEDSGTNEKAA